MVHRSIQAGVDDETLRASVIIPTYGRRDSLLRVLRALARQTISPATFEVIVICDGDVDGSVPACRALAASLPYTLTIIEQNNRGPAAARNAGVAAARAPLIIFIDDDVVADATLIEAHLAAHAGHSRRVTIGPLLPPLDMRLSPWCDWEEYVLCRQYDDMLAGRWHATYRQFYTGNAAVPKQYLVEVGGFDPAYKRAEDVELALRLRDHGVQFTFLPEARAWHYVQRTYQSWLRMSAAYGEADVAMARSGRVEVLNPVAEEFRLRNVGVRALTHLCIGRPALTAVIVWLLGLIIRGTALIGAPAPGKILCSLVFNLRYYNGLADALGGRAGFKALLRGRSVATLLHGVS